MTADTTATGSPTSAPPTRVSEGQVVCDLIARPYNAHLATLVEVKGLVDSRMKVEIECQAYVD